MFELYWDDLSGFFDKGGLVLYFVFFLALCLWSSLIERYIYISYEYKKHKIEVLKEINLISKDNKFKDEIKRYFCEQTSLKLRAGMPFINTIIIVCPLVGLLGTVTGMIEVFDVMAIQGSANVKSMASGVSMATIPTMAGMVVALSGLLFEKKLELSITNHTQELELEIQKVI
ncbi:MAG: MotA/TolQ/ExbB proton channel family protein [Campylobacteraceae bacterium]|nr:MotA/TolQ/ExbB proton channel family protein [Campylobacteraceae bacterium]